MTSWGHGRRLALAFAMMAVLAGCGSDPSDAAPSTPARGPATTAAQPKAPPRLAARPTPPPAPSPRPVPSEPPVESAPVVVAKPASYPPKDECATLPGFAAFRAALFGAVGKRDAAALVALADPAINLDFGGGSGPDELRKRLTDSPVLWGELAALDGLGCANDGGVVTIPWIFSRLPDAADAYTAMLVTGQGVPLRSKAGAQAREVVRLDWALVDAVAPLAPVATRPPTYREVTWGGGNKATRGFVESAKLRDVLDYRLIADRQNGEWKITAFVAGD